ncbi:hypothetical protein GCM10017044_02750 [Kordiimonas sediminis]|uniref:Ice-binding protein C-terminal domain-containing protein n=1 Tax=Kordiimonas sediminis TaxID=1735581 RepID=A0A919AJZ1_9PROT|nr:PEPxxWA-CTERM sorting domain-containing protein [Kordiimonas sediminis]GHF12269.1 hypothetical protein GCM10017044_02750 [Kordiimonas sediminis]
MRKLISAAVLALGFAMPSQAAVTFDFINDDPNGADAPGAWNNKNERAEMDGTILEFDGIYIEFSASSTYGDGYAYFDSGNAGLGVCSNIGDRTDFFGNVVSNQCVPGSDDNLTQGENLTLTFWYDAAGTQAAELQLYDIVFRNAAHEVITDYNFNVNGSDMAMGGYDSGSVNHSYTFAYANQNANQYYISSISAISAVPEPATWLMLILGFGMVGVATRRRNKIALA